MEYIVNLSCPDKSGLVRLVSGWLFEQGCNILDSDQFRDDASNVFFMRVHFEGETDLQALRTSFASVIDDSAAAWDIWSCAEKVRTVILVSKQDHCLDDLLYRCRKGELPIEVALIVSNHTDAAELAARDHIEFLHLPITPDSKSIQEAVLLEEIQSRGIELVVLARYMQILSPAFCGQLEGKIINIHHSFLPSFKGAGPYRQAFERGVKVIGATAHYVTSDLDEGPIIEQDTEQVDHRSSVADLVVVGRDIERVVLSKAVRNHAEHRVLINGSRTVVFS